eukprot:m.404329 g.404329  ORF g.404329 m.404329 type:complete len:170 (-) comp20125_c0_seq10:62-571(-)
MTSSSSARRWGIEVHCCASACVFTTEFLFSERPSAGPALGFAQRRIEDASLERLIQNFTHGQPRRHVCSLQGAGDRVPPRSTIVYDIEIADRREHIPDDTLDFFTPMDENNDRRISKEEVQLFLKRLGGDDYPKVEQHTKLLFQDDADKDGFVTWHEFNGPKKRLVDEL